MTTMREKLTEAINAKNNDINTFVWKLARTEDGKQEEIKLIDATPEQLNKFYNHCYSMLNNTDKNNPGRKTLLKIISEQRANCNAEIFLRELETGAICADGRGYKRYDYLPILTNFIINNREKFAEEELNKMSISVLTGSLPREFESLTIDKVREACLDKLDIFDNKHITFSFIMNLGLYLSHSEMEEFSDRDEKGKFKVRIDKIKERLNINPKIPLFVKPSGLSFIEMRAMLKLNAKKYSLMTTDQLTTLRNKVLFRLEEEVLFHIRQWETRMKQIEKVCEARGITLTMSNS